MKKPNEPSPIIQQYLAIKEQYKDCILFFRLGDFYEMFFDDAKIASKELDLTLTGKDCSLDERAPMCGVPYHAYESYAQKLIERGYKVAICEQTDNIVNKIVQREIVRIITPGTVMETSMLNESQNTYIMCIYYNKNTISYAYSDLSTGEFNVGEYSGNNVIGYINDQIVRIMPSEIICNHSMMEIANKLPIMQSNDKYRFNEYYEWAFNPTNAENAILKQYNLSSIKGYDFSNKNIIYPIGALLEYFKETQKRELKHLKMPRLLKDSQYMYLDTNTRRNLEIEQTMREGGKYGSLLWVIDQTCTSGGARLLRNWVRQPLQNKAEIDNRLDMVQCITEESIIRANLKQLLTSVQDIERLVGKIAYGNITPKDCLALAQSLAQEPQIKQQLLASKNANLIHLADDLVDTLDVVKLINSTIAENPPAIMKEGGYIRAGFNENLSERKMDRAFTSACTFWQIFLYC